MSECQHENQHRADTLGAKFLVCLDCDYQIVLGENCRSGCITKDHATYADCLADARIGIDKWSLRP